MNSTASIHVEMQGPLAVLSLAQAARGNPIDGDFARDFKAIAADLLTAQAAGRLRAVLLRGEGPNFSYGGDLKSMYPIRDRLGEMVRTWTADLHMGLQRFWQLPVPVVCAAQGFVMGGGLAVAAGADVLLGSEGSRYGSAFAQLGFSCDSGSSVTWTARMGMARARRFVLLAEVLTSAEAMQCGLIDRVLPDDQLQAEALALATRLAQGPTLAYGQIKRLFLQAGSAQLTAQLEDEALTLARLASTADAQDGVAAMVERRKPVFNGR